MSTRAEFLKKSFRMVTGAIAQAIDAKLPENIKNITLPIFPPGAVDNFHEVCSSCGDCVPACPENAIQMIPESITGKDLPVIKPSQNACIMCTDLPCMKSCPDNALIASQESFPAIGLARIVEDKCIAYSGNMCMTCYDACPLKRQAIVLKANKPVINPEHCTGCGICENMCILENEKGVIIEAI